LRYHGSVPTYHVENFGCRATQADGAALERQFDARGLARTSAARADVVILNTCTVTNSADQDARAAIRSVQRQNPLARIIVTGCYAQRAPEEIAALPGVSAVIGNSHKHQLAEIVLTKIFTLTDRSENHECERVREGHDFSRAINGVGGKASAAEVDSSGRRQAFFPISALTGNRELRTENRVFVSDIFAHTELQAAPVFESANFDSANANSDESGRTRPNLKVQDGCDNRCSFCIIPRVRGHSRSLPSSQVIREMNALVDAGYREVVISGINLGRWGRDFEAAGPKQHFEFLLRAILAETGLEKLRISSIEPMDWSDRLIALVASSPRIAKHAHVPLQSGSDAVLRRMHRKYRPWHYREKIEKIRAAMPAAAIGADVMAGFPGETDAEFDATRHLIAELPFTYLHVFTYSPRPGTPASTVSNQVPVHIARERNRILRDLATEKKLAFMQSFIGKPLQAITLNVTHQGSGGEFTEALTDNYQKLYLRGSHAPNRWLTAQIEGAENGALVGSSN
jgi:threonylcarbamoyladenosine tRNA methylthiotransferase MtaB